MKVYSNGAVRDLILECESSSHLFALQQSKLTNNWSLSRNKYQQQPCVIQFPLPFVRILYGFLNTRTASLFNAIRNAAIHEMFYDSEAEAIVYIFPSRSSPCLNLNNPWTVTLSHLTPQKQHWPSLLDDQPQRQVKHCIQKTLLVTIRNRSHLGQVKSSSIIVSTPSKPFIWDSESSSRS